MEILTQENIKKVGRLLAKSEGVEFQVYNYKKPDPTEFFIPQQVYDAVATLMSQTDMAEYIENVIHMKEDRFCMGVYIMDVVGACGDYTLLPQSFTSIVKEVCNRILALIDDEYSYPENDKKLAGCASLLDAFYNCLYPYSGQNSGFEVTGYADGIIKFYVPNVAIYGTHHETAESTCIDNAFQRALDDQCFCDICEMQSYVKVSENYNNQRAILIMQYYQATGRYYSDDFSSGKYTTNSALVRELKDISKENEIKASLSKNIKPDDLSDSELSAIAREIAAGRFDQTVDLELYLTLRKKFVELKPETPNDHLYYHIRDLMQTYKKEGTVSLSIVKVENVVLL